MKKRLILAVVLLAVTALAVTGCCEAKVKVRTGERVVCTYGETISSSIKVIEVPASEADKYKVKTRTVVCKRHSTLEKLYAEAQKALAAGDKETAKARLAEILAIDPNFRNASTQSSDLNAGKVPVPDTSTPPTSTPDPGVPKAPVAGLAEWVPDEIAGYEAQPVIADELALTRVYLPKGGGSISSVTVVAEKHPTDSLAESAAKTLIASQYSANQGTLKIKGRTLRFGTYASYAAVSWSEGAVQVTIEARAKSGAATALKAELQSIASAIIP